MIRQKDVLLAVINQLVALLHRPVGLAEIPKELVDEEPYMIVYPLSPDFDGPPFTRPWEDVDFGVQVTSVGLRCDQALWMADRAREAILERGLPLMVPGGVEMGRSIELGPELVEGDSVDTVVQRFVFHLTPT